MANKTELRAWIRQARADLGACIGGSKSPLSECHRRYLLQQACEKGVKALGLVLWDESADITSFNRFFSHRHDPLSRLRTQQDLPRSLRALLRQIDAELDLIDNAPLLRQVDATSPVTDPTEMSYRYPFVDSQKGLVLAPVDVRTDQWDAYQGNELGVSRAVGRPLDLVEGRVRRSRAPR